jgi:hypothetical protein
MRLAEIAWWKLCFSCKSWLSRNDVLEVVLARNTLVDVLLRRGQLFIVVLLVHSFQLECFWH